MSNLQNKFDRYFPETSDEDLDFVRNPFTFSIEKLSDECQNKFLELINNSGARQEYQEKPLSHFWVGLKGSYPQTTKTALRILILFVSTYQCESRFSSLLQIKAEHRNTVDLRLRMICVVHCHKLHLASNYFQKTNKNKFHIDREEN